MDLEGFGARVRSARGSGVVHVEHRSRAQLGPSDPRDAADALVTGLGMKALGPRWRGITREAAGDALRGVLHSDMAYESETMDLATASAFADEFLAWFKDPGWFYTNGVFLHAERPESWWRGSWDPVTKATFDTGVVAVDDSSAGLLWVEDED